MLIETFSYTLGSKAGAVVIAVHRNKKKLPRLHMKTSSFLTRTTKTSLTIILLHLKRSIKSKLFLILYHLHQVCQQKKNSRSSIQFLVKTRGTWRGSSSPGTACISKMSARPAETCLHFAVSLLCHTA